MAKRTKFADDTRAMGFFNFAEAYWLSAKALKDAEVKGTPYCAYPVFLLYYQAIELYLKAYLRVHGHTVAQLRSKFGHDAALLSKRAIELGASFKPKERALFVLMAKADAAMSARYSTSGYRLPKFGALERTCKSLREVVGWRIADLTDVPVPGLHPRRRKRKKR